MDVTEEFDVHHALMEWYVENRRDLPWRRGADPYRILISELMLQQTQAHRVVPYFQTFVARFPTFDALAAAPRADVIRLWSGLGYNRRAVQLHRLAQVVVERHGGQLPADRKALQKLPGIGPYTAGAILSIGFGRAEVALDTNARRVIARYGFETAPSEPELWEAATRLLPAERCGEWNQALMDLGSTICVNSRPRCLVCPIRRGCRSAGQSGPRPGSWRRAAGSPFRGSNRYYRGRLLAELRGLPGESMVPVAEVAEKLARQGVAEPLPGWVSVGEALARDGLARVEETSNGVAVGLA